FGPRCDICHKEYLQLGIRKYDRTHITAVSNQTWRPPKIALTLQERLAYGQERRNTRSQLANRLFTNRLCHIVAADDNLLALKADFETPGYICHRRNVVVIAAFSHDA